MKRRSRKLTFPMGKDCPQYRRVWIIVDSAVAEAFKAHPEYLSDDAVLRVVRASIVKRVTGAITGWATQVEQARFSQGLTGEIASVSPSNGRGAGRETSRGNRRASSGPSGAGFLDRPAP